MVLLLDLGNTNLYVGVYQDGKLKYEYRTYSDLLKSSFEYKELLEGFLNAKHLSKDDFKGAILSSVIPSLTRVIANAVNELLDVECKVLGNSLKSGLSIRIDNPSELGADLVADCVGGKERYGYPLIIVDLGTASKLLAIDEKGNYVGGVILSGIKVSFNALIKNAAQLMDTSLVAPKKVIGKNTIDSLNSGAIYGTIEMIEGLSKRIEEELGYKCKKILTGGNSALIKDNISKDYIYDHSLILEGLYQIYLKNR
ncbi:MAG: type III pantothenate kinase [Bacillales bacterium]|nr:type III pantothenate kinase [Bacillales bacterium]